MPSWLLLNLLRRWTQSVIKLHTRLLLLFPLFCSSSNRRHQRLIHCTSEGEIKDNMAGSPQKTVYTSTPLWASHGAGLDECCAVNTIGLPVAFVALHYVKKQKAESRLPLGAALKLCGRNPLALEPSWEVKRWLVLIAYWQAAWQECVCMIRKRPHAAMGGVARATGGEQKECTTLEQSQGREVIVAAGFGEDPKRRHTMDEELRVIHFCYSQRLYDH